MGTIVSQITSLTVVYSTVHSNAENIKAPGHWPLLWGIHRGPVNSPHKWPVTRKMFPFDDVIMMTRLCFASHIKVGCCLCMISFLKKNIQKVIIPYFQLVTRRFLSPNSKCDISDVAVFSQTIYSDAFLWIKSFIFWLKCHWSLFLRVQLTIIQHWNCSFQSCLTDWYRPWDPQTMILIGPRTLGMGPLINVFIHWKFYYASQGRR